jgi:hypothetical protein
MLMAALIAHRKEGLRALHSVPAGRSTQGRLARSLHLHPGPWVGTTSAAAAPALAAVAAAPAAAG